MTLLRYDEPGLVRALEQLDVPRRSAFAAACAQRLLPAYGSRFRGTHFGDPDALSELLGQLWSDLEGDRLRPEDLDELIARCMTLIPTDASNDGEAAAQDAVTAVAYALRCRKSGSAAEAGWAARSGYDALDTFIIEREKIEHIDRNVESRILSHPLVQAELSRQLRDLRDLATEGAELSDLVGALRRRSENEAETMFAAPR